MQGAGLLRSYGDSGKGGGGVGGGAAAATRGGTGSTRGGIATGRGDRDRDRDADLDDRDADRARLGGGAPGGSARCLFDTSAYAHKPCLCGIQIFNPTSM